LTHNGERITAKCITSMTSDVQWISDRPPGSDRATPKVAEESGSSEAIDCIECGAKIPAEKRAAHTVDGATEEIKFLDR
jgi:hypothetical protein